jgi:4-hydroxy-3-polyprenylbenzoate decarboxylase
MANLDAQSLRPFLSQLQQGGALLRVSDPVSPHFELSAWLAELARQPHGGPAVQFDNVKGARLRAVGNLLGSRERIAQALGLPVDRLQERIIAAAAHGLAPTPVTGAPCQEVVLRDPDLARELPVPTFFPRETGAYITAGVIIARDRLTGRGNASYARLKLLDANRAMIGIAPNHHLAVLARAAHARGEQLPLAVCIGNHPAVLIAAALYLRLGEDELEAAGALLGEALRTVKCKSSELAVPAGCEIVLEGSINMGQSHEEVLVSEYHGMYEAYGAGSIVTFDCMTRRADALFQVIQPGYYPEHVLLGGVPIAAGIAAALRDAALPVREVAVGMGGAGRLKAVVSLTSPRAGDAQKAMLAAFAQVNLVKHVTVVDDDIDPWNGEQVEWAVSTRLRAERDLLIVPGARTDRSEPIKQGGVIAKLGMDATRKSLDRADWERALPPDGMARKVGEQVRAALQAQQQFDVNQPASG